MQVLSTQVSDETNMIRLIRLARQQGIQSLEVQLPYGLDIGQLAAISRQCSPQVALTLNGERLLVNLPVIQP
ncbi:hypothetical protein PL78_05475 [Yersinia entomophaga]|uniref:Uncharacterized protein n=1 Tax=Yersinia entomophaga TaxID=935293 RepID=A0ABM6BIA3_YERET|nr:hypothetical protein PL78_05475 [Yersinia entomophaga]